MFSIRRSILALSGTAVTVSIAIALAGTVAARQAEAPRPPAFEVDPSWPTIPNDWVLGEVTSIAVDGRDHIWVLHRPRSIPADQQERAAPPVLEFDASGQLLSSWGGPADRYEWPEREHGIYVDARGFVWISGNGGWPKVSPGGSTDDMILKFTPAGEFVLQIGHRGKSGGNTDTVNVHQPGDIFVHAPTNELFVADGYGNQRVIVFDADTGEFKRMWGAFGNRPETPAPAGRGAGAAAAPPEGPPQFGLVHAVTVSNDGMVYVADRSNNRIQVFRTDGTYVRQVRVAPDGDTNAVPAHFALSPDPRQQFLYVVDSGPMRIVIFDRETLTQVGSVGMRGSGPGEFDIIHHMAADSAGNLYAAEIVTNRRAQRLVVRR